MKAFYKMMATAAIAALCCATACTKHYPYRNTDTTGTERPGGNTPGGGGNTTVKAKLMSNWTIQYKGRENYTEDNGTVSRVERFHVEAPGAAYYLIRTISPDVLQESYGTDLVKFFQAEQGYLEDDAKYYDEKVTDYLYNQTPQDLLFDLIRHGDWKAFIIGFDAKGKITGEYATCNFTVQEDVPTEAFSKWIGDWQISGQDTDGHVVSYNIQISSSEANYAYYVDKWETGASIDKQTGTDMDGEGDWFETFFEPSNGAMYFVSQYVQTYKENGKTYDEYFYGNFYYNGRLVEKGEYIVTDEGLDIAAAQMTNLGNTKAEVNGCAVTVYMTDSDQTGTETQFTSMQYYADDGDQLLKFNLNIPQFPLTMVKTSSGPTSARAMARKPASKLSLKQHTKLRDVQRKENAHHTVARKAASATVVRKAGN